MTKKQTLDTTKYVEVLAGKEYKQDYMPPKQPIIFSIQEKKIATLGGMVCFSGLAKAGKSTFLNAAIASSFIPGDIFGIKLTLPDEAKKIALFDTESNLEDFYGNIRRIERMCNRNHLPKERFNCFSISDNTPEEMQQLIEAYLILNNDCKCIVIDGLTDMVYDYNNPTEASRLKMFLKRMVKEHGCSFIGVLHSGKGDGEMLGHFGGAMKRFAQSILFVEKDKNVADVLILTSNGLRSSKAFEPIAISRNDDDGTYFEIDAPQESKMRTYKDWDFTEHKRIASQTLKEKGSEYNEVIEYIRASQAVGVTASKYIFKKWREDGIIFMRDRLWFYQV